MIYLPKLNTRWPKSDSGWEASRYK